MTELAIAVKEAEHLIFDGLQAYQGSIQHELDHDQRKTELDAVIERVKVCLDSLAAASVNCPVVSGGGTAVFCLRPHLASMRQCGSYAFMDADYGRIHNQNGKRLDKAEWKMHCLF